MKNFLSEEIRNQFLLALEQKTGKKIVWVDMDGVICNFKKKVEEWGKNLGITCEEFKEKKLYRNKNFYLELEPIEGAIESVKALGEKYEVRILSAPSWKNVHSFTEKRVWVEHYFGDWGFKRMDLSFRKDLSMGHYLIDDRTKYGAPDFIGEHIHYGTEKFPDWNTVSKYLL